MKLQEVKKLVLIALASDDSLVETLVLKGGNALELLESKKRNGISRASYDLDFSMSDDFDSELDEISCRIRELLEQTFSERDHRIIDYYFSVRPGKIRESVKDFWGGYYIQFKIVTNKNHRKHSGNSEELRKKSIPILPNNSPKVEIEISKYEYVGSKIEYELDGFLIYLYSPQMLIFEKLRAICQQHPEYAQIVPSHSPRARARDFYDIYLICELHNMFPLTENDLDVARAIFEAKRVPLSFISLIEENAAIHLADWQSVIDTVSAKEEINPFDFYLDFVLKSFGNLAIL
jgi:predicted nucleotidyltransferase component of viral defense system